MIRWIAFRTILAYCPLLMSAQSFDSLLDVLPEIPIAQKTVQIAEYIRSAGGLPLLEGDSVIFVVNSPWDLPKIMSGFNGFLNRRYITDSTAGDMHNIQGTSWHYLKKKLAPDARIFYQYFIGGNPQNDPLNYRLGYRFNLINSEFRMPDFKVQEELISDQFIPKGEVSSITLASDIFNQGRTLHVYLPPGYHLNNRDYPTAYFHDGSFYVQWGKVPQILDYLIAHGKIAPLIAVFDDPFDRGKEYRGDKNYADYIQNELIPYIDKEYQTRNTPEQRALIGGSRGGLSALLLSHSSSMFSKCGTFSPAIHPLKIEEFTSLLSASDYHPQEVVIIGAIYDKIWYADALALKTYFEDQEIRFKYQSISQGHNIQAWINYLDNMLIAFFPANGE